MKNLFISGFLSLFVVAAGLNTQAAVTSPRDLVCDLGSGSRVVLKSNNGFWSVLEKDKYIVDLVLENDLGESETLSASWVNNKASHNRGNDQGERQYIFTSKNGQDFFVTLEFFAPFGLAEGIKLFRVLSTSLQFELKNASLKGKCNLVFHPRNQ